LHRIHNGGFAGGDVIVHGVDVYAGVGVAVCARMMAKAMLLVKAIAKVMGKAMV
jgi:hypothetical protein